MMTSLVDDNDENICHIRTYRRFLQMYILIALI